MSVSPKLSRSLREAVLTQVGSLREEIIQLVVDLVRIPSESHPPGGDQGKVQQYIAGLFRELALEVDTFEPWSVAGVTDHPGWWPGLDYKDRPNVVGVWK